MLYFICKFPWVIINEQRKVKRKKLAIALIIVRQLKIVLFQGDTLDSEPPKAQGI